MSKINVEHLMDISGKPFIRLSKKRGAISHIEAYEAMSKEGLYGPYLINFRVPEEAPVDLYENGDFWDVYEPRMLFETILDEQVEEAFGQGYEACMRDYKL